MDISKIKVKFEQLVLKSNWSCVRNLKQCQFNEAFECNMSNI